MAIFGLGSLAVRLAVLTDKWQRRGIRYASGQPCERLNSLDAAVSVGYDAPVIV
jgi:hypothetical protein